ncbi:MAG: S1C family serine protease [Vicinamibacterales bacterium]
MSTSPLSVISESMADAVASAAPAVVQVQGRRRPASGVVYQTDVVLTTARALGRDDGVRVRTHDGRMIDAELAGWDPATGLVVLRASGLGLPPAARADLSPRVGHLALAIARSWSNAVTASAGIVAVIGGPLRTGRGRAIDEVIRTTAPMHDGFAGGAFVNTSGAVIGVTTAAAIRGLAVVIPAAIAWKTATDVLEHGSPKRGFLGIAGQPVRLGARQRGDSPREGALLVTSVTPGSPADEGGVLVGDVILEFDGHAVESPEELLELLTGDRVGRVAPLRVLRGGQAQDLRVTVGTREAS